MAYFVVPLAAFAASLLTLFSGFGLGTLLMPVVAIFFPVELAIALTAVVHLANNAFKALLLGRHANGAVCLRFGIPAVAAAFVGALLLGLLSDSDPLFDYDLLGRTQTITAIGLVTGLLVLFFVAVESSPRLARATLEPKWLPLGGMVSGFFGGLSGHQGAFRSLFLLKAGLDKQAFVATGIVIAMAIDLARTGVYGLRFIEAGASFDWPLVGAATSPRSSAPISDPDCSRRSRWNRSASSSRCCLRGSGSDSRRGCSRSLARLRSWPAAASAATEATSCRPLRRGGCVRAVPRLLISALRRSAAPLRAWATSFAGPGRRWEAGYARAAGA